MIELARIFQNGMTLQRQKTIRIWGNTDSVQRIRVFLNEEEILSDFLI